MSRPGSPEELLRPLETFGIRPGLDTIRTMLTALGRPDAELASVLVAGTNGKGSTACLLAAQAAAAGYRVGLYTSPHLESVTERIRVDGTAIDPDELAAELERVLAAARKRSLPITYFEALTAAALARFAAHRVDLVVLEVGLGGRLDATNAVEPVLALIGEISRDHESHLGATLAAIAGEKAGILRAGRPAIALRGCAEVRAALQAAAAARSVDLVYAGDLVRVREVAPGRGSERQVEVATPEGRRRVRLALAGGHQLDNLALAVAAARELDRLGFAGVGGGAALDGIEACRWPGRLERVAVGGGRTVLLDAAHNPSGAESLTRYLEDEPAGYRLLFGALADKAVGSMLPRLAVAAGEVFLTEPPGAKAWTVAELRSLAGRGVAEPSFESALDRALAGSWETLVVCGSLYLVGAARASLRRRFGVPPPASDPLWPALRRRR